MSGGLRLTDALQVQFFLRAWRKIFSGILEALSLLGQPDLKRHGLFETTPTKDRPDAPVSVRERRERYRAFSSRITAKGPVRGAPSVIHEDTECESEISA